MNRLIDEWVRWQVVREQRAVARDNIRAGCYTDGTPMTLGDRSLYQSLTILVRLIIAAILLMVSVTALMMVIG